MKQPIFSLLAILSIYHSAFSQKKEEINFSDPLQIDSSEYYLIPMLVDNDDLPVYGKGRGYLPWGDYKNIYFYNSKTGTSKKLFDGQRTLILSFNRHYYFEKLQVSEIPANILSGQIVYLARTEDFNNDKALDSDDPLYLFISTKTGENLKQITPKGLHVISWTVSKDKKMILVKAQNDKNNNKKFGQGDDQLFFRIDLDNDVSKINCYPIEIKDDSPMKSVADKK
jgi:hypothetical protein